MKHAILAFLIAGAALFGVAGCSTPYKITSYDEKGNVTSVSEGEKDVIEKITDATRDKLVIAWSTGWAAYIEAIMAEAESGTVTPTGKIYVGKVAKGYLSIPKGFSCIGISIAEIIAATHENLSVGFTGASAASDTASAGTTQTTTSAGSATGSASTASETASAAIETNEATK